MTDHSETLLNHMWITYKSRYNAHHRLLRIAAWEVITPSIIGILILAVNLFGILPGFSTLVQSRSWINLYSIVGSVAVIALSIYHGRSQTAVRAERALRNALELQKLYDLSKVSSTGDCGCDCELANEYHRVLESNSDNHHPLDYERAKIDADMNVPRRLWLGVKSFVTFYFIHVALITTSIAAGLLIIKNG